MIETNIDSARAKELEAIESPEVMKQFDTQIENIMKAGIAFSYNKPAVAGGIIMRCANPQEVYDAAFVRSSDNDNQKKSNVVPFVAAKEVSEPSKFHAAFEYATARYHLGSDFAMAARAPAQNAGNTYVPALQAA